MVRGELCRRGGGPVRRDDRAVRAPSPRDERLRASLRLRPAVPDSPVAQGARALRPSREGLVLPARRDRRTLLFPRRKRHVKRHLKIIVLSSLALFPMLGSTQEYPTRPVRVVVPYSAGGSSDGPMRVIAQEMSKRMGQQMVVENKPGQGAMLGSAEVVKAAPDGYTLLLASNPNAISASLYSRLTHDPVEDFAPITLLASEQAVLLVHPSVPARNVREFIAYVKERPGKVDYSSSGNGSAQHLFMAMFAS